jgi:lysophospholipase L1-like esterase
LTSRTIDFQAASPAQTLTVRYTKVSGSNVTLQAATLIGEVAPLSLPFSDNFDDGDSDGWAFVNETPSADSWNAASGSLVQTNSVESVASFEESFHLGSYAWLPAGASLSDYRFSARLGRTGNGRAESYGVLFRYRDADNFYRFTLNTRYGFGRLEKRENGLYYTLAINALGDDPSSPFDINIDVDGPDIRVSIDGSPIMAAIDNAHPLGSVGLFTQSPSEFDDVVIDPIAAAPDVQLTSPIELSVVPGDQVAAAAVVRGLPAGGSVEFSMTGTAPATVGAPPWTTTFSSVPAGLVTVTARILDSGNNQVDSHSVNIAVGGEVVLAIGDSITNGIGDTYAADNDDALRVFSNTAYASTLANRLEAMPPTEVVIYNEGIGGDRATDTDLVRLQSIVDRHPSASTALVQLGTNDANSNRSAAAFESDMQSIVDRLLGESMVVRVATLPPILGGADPLSSTANQRIIEYNDEIKNNLTGSMPGADLWAFFAPDDTGDGIADRIRTDFFADNLHPNALGHAIIADLWYNVLLGDSTGTAIVPFVADSLSRTNYKQNLLEVGDEYLVDSAATLTGVPATLVPAVWIMTAQADVANTATSFLGFDLDRSTTVYVAYDADAGSLPNWLNPATSGFVDTGQLLTTTQTNYRVYSAPYGAGTVVLGGNHATGGGDAADMYLVGLLPDS